MVILFANSAFAQDPGARDSIIIETVWAEWGIDTVYVPIYVTCDDSVGFYNLPITWSSSDSAIYPTEITYHNTIIDWDDTFDSILTDNWFIRMLGWCDISGPDNPHLTTNNVREHCWTIKFAVDWGADPQSVTIDTTFDFLTGSLLFVLAGGVVQFAPVFIPGEILYYALDTDEQDAHLPDVILLKQNYPNPFNASTTIEFSLSEEADVELTIYDLLGREVTVLEQGLKSAGDNEITFDAKGLSSGIYFYRLQAGELTETKRMLLLK
jgi:hypothetical protein